MSLKAFAWCWDNSESGGLDLLALITLADIYQTGGDEGRYYPGGGPWPGHDYIANRCHVSDEEALGAISRLVALGELTIDYQSKWFELPRYTAEDARLHEQWMRVNASQPAAPGTKRLAKPGEVVYLIGSTDAPLVKIGHTINLSGRLKSIQAMSPAVLTVLWTTPGGRDLEARMHDEFSAYRVHGEWFNFGTADPIRLLTAAATAGTEPRR